MTGQEYKRRIAELGLTQASAATFFGVSERTGRYWVQYEPHPAAAKLLEVMYNFSLTVLDVEERVLHGRRKSRRRTPDTIHK
jgi:DNA-binding transcriptional regulator YiaG